MRTAVTVERFCLWVASVVLVAGPLRMGWRARQDSEIQFMPDLFETLAASAGAAEGEQFVGAWSRLGMFHPGPAWFYWAAPFTAFSDLQPASLFLAAMTLVAVCCLGIVVVVVRLMGDQAGLIAALVLMVGLHQLSLSGLAYPWNPTVLILPAALGLVCVAGAASSGSMPMGMVGFLAGSFVAQSHLGAVPLGGGIMLGSAVAVVSARRSRAEMVPPLAWFAVILLALAPWAPVMRDQVDGHGNLGVVTRYLLTGEVDERFPPEPSRSSPSLSVAQVGTRFVAMASLTEQGTARWGGAAVVEGMAHPPPRSSLLVMSILLLAIGFGAMPSSRRPLGRVVIDPFAVWLCRASLVAFAVETVPALRVRGEFRYYLIAGVSGAGLAAWLAAGLVALAVFRATSASLRVDASPQLRVGASALGLAMVVALAQTKPMNDYFGIEAHIDHDDPTILAVMDAAPAGDILLVADRLSTLSATNQVALSLQHHGRSVNVDGPFIAHFADRNRQSKSGVLVRLIAVDVDAPEACEIQGLYNGFKVCVQG